MHMHPAAPNAWHGSTHTHANHHSHLTTPVAIRSSRHSSHLLAAHAQCAGSPRASQHKRSESVSSLLFELELEDSEDTAAAPRLPLELVWGEALPANEELAELWKHALKAKEELLEEAAGSSNSSVDVAAFAEALAECGYTVWLRRGTYTCPVELGLSHIRHTFVVVSLTTDSGSQPAEYYVVDPNYKEHFQLGGSGAGEYQALLALLPSVFVGGAEQWQNLVHLLCKEMERVFDARGVSLPPWRSPSIVLGHWLVNQADDTQVSPSSSTLASRMVSAELTLPGVSGISASMLPVYPHAGAAAETLSPPAAADTPTVDELAAV